ncbi:MAG TPA: dTMP kinase [Terriglobales bacterium]|jgi:dTMP kinase|nr:dTMP kinase [Terriglobales bacterium]
MRGVFITFEGLDGCGKSTQTERLASVLLADGYEVVVTREPGGTIIGEQIRGLLLNSRTQGMSPLTELALMFGSRAQLIQEVIRPALGSGKVILCDRYTDSSEAYQGGGRQLGSKPVLDLHHIVCSGLNPDITILMDSEVRASVARARKRNQQATNGGGALDENRFERENAAFFERVHQAYLAIARREPSRVFMVDARREADVVHSEIVEHVRRKLAVFEARSESRK